MKKDAVGVANLSMSNLFSLFDLEPIFDLDLEILDRNYFSVQSILHPDRFVMKTEEEKQLAQIKAAEINQAYKNLKHPLKRAEILLSIVNISASSESSVQDPEALMEIMELREELETLQGRGELNSFHQAIKKRFNETCEQFSAAWTQKDSKGLMKLYLRLSYLSKIQDEIKTPQRQFSLS